MDILNGLIGVLLGTTLQMGSVSVPVRAWSCGPVTWGETPVVVNSMFKGRADITCQYEGTSGGGLKQLALHFVDTAKRQATQIHQGPDEVVFQNLPATHYDATFDRGHEGDHITWRADIYIGTDEKTRLLNASFSKNVSGTGSAAYLRKEDHVLDVEPLDTPHHYQVKASISLNVAQPSFIPTSLFKSQTQIKVESEIDANKESIAEELIENT